MLRRRRIDRDRDDRRGGARARGRGRSKPNPFADRQTIWAEFDNVNGLGSIDRDIRVAGVNEGEIGEVARIGDDALVELEVDDDVVVHADAQVALRPHTLFEGSAFVDLHPGSPSAPRDRRGRDDPAPADHASTSRSTRRCGCSASRSASSLRELVLALPRRLGGERAGGAPADAAQRARS